MGNVPQFTAYGNTVQIDTQTTTANVALGSHTNGLGSRVIRVVNGGADLAFVNFGDSAVVASATTSIPVPAGVVCFFEVGGAVTHAAAITEATENEPTVYFTEGQGGS